MGPQETGRMRKVGDDRGIKGSVASASSCNQDVSQEAQKTSPPDGRTAKGPSPLAFIEREPLAETPSLQAGSGLEGFRRLPAGEAVPRTDFLAIVTTEDPVLEVRP
jgi:hypothetical protein